MSERNDDTCEPFKNDKSDDLENVIIPDQENIEIKESIKENEVINEIQNNAGGMSKLKKVFIAIMIVFFVIEFIAGYVVLFGFYIHGGGKKGGGGWGFVLLSLFVSTPGLAMLSFINLIFIMVDCLPLIKIFFSIIFFISKAALIIFCFHKEYFWSYMLPMIIPNFCVLITSIIYQIKTMLKKN